MMNLFNASLSSFLIIVLSGCTPVSHMTQSEAYHRQILFPVNKGESNIYIHSDQWRWSTGQNKLLFFDSKLILNSTEMFCLKITTSPGSHKIVSLTNNLSSITIDAKSGKNYFIWREIENGYTVNRSKLHLVTKEKGKLDIQKCLSITNITVK